MHLPSHETHVVLVLLGLDGRAQRIDELCECGARGVPVALQIHIHPRQFGQLLGCVVVSRGSCTGHKQGLSLSSATPSALLWLLNTMHCLLRRSVSLIIVLIL